MEFEVKKKKMRVLVEGQAHEFACPTIGQTEVLQEKLKSVEPEKSFLVYVDFLKTLGLPEAVTKGMDNDTFLDFIKFVLYPKKN